ncbi:unnamed protein product (plasmid) [Klebsiella pneumoniae]|nr:unnamed protein product [Klebsiella pneumoniae]
MHQDRTEQGPAATTNRVGAKRRCPAECRQSFAGTVKAARPVRSQQALPLTFQTSDTSRQARNRFAGSAEPGRCVAAALAECGSTTGQPCWSGAEGVQCCYAFDVKALKG